MHCCANTRNKDSEVTMTWAGMLCAVVLIVEFCLCAEKHSGLLLDLVHELIQLAQTVDDDNSHSSVAVEAGRCLGVIGIIDIGLVTPCGRPANVELETAVSAMSDSADMQQSCHVFHALADYLTDSELVHCIIVILCCFYLSHCYCCDLCVVCLSVSVSLHTLMVAIFIGFLQNLAHTSGTLWSKSNMCIPYFNPILLQIGRYPHNAFSLGAFKHFLCYVAVYSSNDVSRQTPTRVSKRG